MFEEENREKKWKTEKKFEKNKKKIWKKIWKKNQTYLFQKICHFRKTKIVFESLD